MTKEELNEVFDKCKELHQGIRIELEMLGQRDPEIVINTFYSLAVKQKYYEKNFDDNLVHKNNNRIKIVGASPIQIRRGKSITI